MKTKRLLVVLTALVAIAILGACGGSADGVVAQTKVGETKILVEKTGDSTARLVSMKSGEAKEIYQIANIDFDENCMLAPGHDLERTTVLLTYQACPTEEDNYNHSKMFILLDVNDEGASPIAFGKDTFCEEDYDGDGIVEAVTTYDANGICRVIAYDSVGGKVVCADPEEAMLHLYGIRSEGAHMPYGWIEDGVMGFTEAVFESNNYIGVRVLFADLEFKELDSCEIVEKLAGKETLPTGDNASHPNNALESGGNEIYGQFFVSCQVEPFHENPSGNHLEFYIPYKIEVSADRKISSVEVGPTSELDPPLKIWGTSAWNHTDEIVGTSYLSVFTGSSPNDWDIQISEDGHSVHIENPFQIYTTQYDEVTKKSLSPFDYVKIEKELYLPM